MTGGAGSAEEPYDDVQWSVHLTEDKCMCASHP
jgi:hypothetical protein